MTQPAATSGCSAPHFPPPSFDLQPIVPVVLKAAIEGGRVLRSKFRTTLSVKTKRALDDVVTEADLAADHVITSLIRTAFPEHSICSEESDPNQDTTRGPCWIIDPLDGTRNFALGISSWTSLVVFVHNGEILVGAAYDPVSDQAVWAAKGQGAWWGDRKLQVDNDLNLPLALTFVGLDPRDPLHEWGTEFSNLLCERFTHTQNNLGSMWNALHVATGGVALALSNSGKDWDYAAPALIVREAGGVVVRFDGSPWKLGSRDFVATTVGLEESVSSLLARSRK